MEKLFLFLLSHNSNRVQLLIKILLSVFYFYYISFVFTNKNNIENYEIFKLLNKRIVKKYNLIIKYFMR